MQYFSHQLNVVKEFLLIMNLVMIIFALVLLLATLEADGQSFKRPDSKLLSDGQQVTTSSLGRKAEAGAGEARYPTANNANGAAASLVAASKGDDDNNPTFGQYGCTETGSSNPENHHAYMNGNNPYAPKPKKSP